MQKLACSIYSLPLSLSPSPSLIQARGKKEIPINFLLGSIQIALIESCEATGNVCMHVLAWADETRAIWVRTCNDDTAEELLVFAFVRR